MYRFHTLDGARAKAARLGWRGALYAWESARTGAETSPEQVIGPDRQVINVLCGRQEQHISADIAYAVWQYWEATRDEGFLLDAGAEILFETARFWASRAVPEADGLRHIRGVIGPDEYHEHIDDNAFTNVMARWNIRRGLDVAALLRERWPTRWASLSHGLTLDDAELQQWRDAADTLKTGLNPKTGLFEEFAGYFELENIDLSAYAGRSVPMDVVLRPRADAGVSGGETGRRRRPFGVVARRVRQPDGSGELPLLRTALWPWQFPQSRIAWARRRAARRRRNGSELFRPDGRDRSVRRPRCCRRRGTHCGAGRAVDDDGPRVRGCHPPKRGYRPEPAVARGLGRVGVSASMARPPPSDIDRRGQSASGGYARKRGSDDNLYSRRPHEA